MILGLDLGNSTGWAIYDEADQRIVDAGVKIVGKAGQSWPTKLAALDNVVEAVCIFRPVTRIATEKIEFVGKGGGRAAASQAAYRISLELWCHKHDMPLMLLAPATVKKFATGRPGVAKRAMILTAMAEWPDLTWPKPERTWEHKADACWIAACAAAKLHEREVIARATK